MFKGHVGKRFGQGREGGRSGLQGGGVDITGALSGGGRRGGREEGVGGSQGGGGEEADLAEVIAEEDCVAAMRVVVSGGGPLVGGVNGHLFWGREGENGR